MGKRMRSMKYKYQNIVATVDRTTFHFIFKLSMNGFESTVKLQKAVIKQITLTEANDLAFNRPCVFQYTCAVEFDN